MQLTTKEYAEKRKISMRAVTKAITKGHALPGVKSFKRINRSYLLIINKALFEKYLEDNQLLKK